MNRPALLDVNLLMALFDPDHVHHDLAHDWFAENHARGWATCALTENAFVRILANPSYGSPISRPAELVERLGKLCASRNHRFWAETVSLRDTRLFDPARLGGHRQVTDAYLLGLAHRNGGCLATFDRTIPVRAINGAPPDLLEVISLADD